MPSALRASVPEVTDRGTDRNADDSHEQRVEAPLIVLVAVGLQVLLASVSIDRGWTTLGIPGWAWLIGVVPELVLILALTLPGSRRRLERSDHRREVSIALVAVIGVVNLFSLAILIGSLIKAQETHGVELLLKGLSIWGTNVIAFGLLFWELDGGGPDARRSDSGLDRDFQFPQTENPQLVSPGWQPQLIDYVYISFTNSIAFSPTDAMPLSRRCKLLMLNGSAISAVTVLLVAARAVNILN